jgi:hypothetical protein
LSDAGKDFIVEENPLVKKGNNNVANSPKLTGNSFNTDFLTSVEKLISGTKSPTKEETIYSTSLKRSLEHLQI